MRNSRITALIAPAVTLCLLGGAWAERELNQPSPAASDSYHARVQQQAEALPRYIGTWLGIDAPVPPAAVKMLRPNVIISRGYQDVASGQRVAFLLVHCRDARDLLGHWPPVCYVGQGWTMQSATPRDWEVDGLVVAATQYEFTASRAGRPSRLSIDGFFVLPGGRICRDMNEVDAVARDRNRKMFGAAQIQIVSDGTLTSREREDVVAMLVRAVRPTINAIGRGVSK